MSDLNFWYPALLFPAIPLMMISFGNRYSTLAALIRGIHDSIILNNSTLLSKSYLDQLRILTTRLQMVRFMQTLSAISFLSNLLTIYSSYLGFQDWALFIFGFAVLSFFLAIIVFIIEIQFSLHSGLPVSTIDLRTSKRGASDIGGLL